MIEDGNENMKWSIRYHAYMFNEVRLNFYGMLAADKPNNRSNKLLVDRVVADDYIIVLIS